jgi:hypothetical protein
MSATGAAMMADWITTVHVINLPDHWENNSILGKHPSNGKIAAYGAAETLGSPHLAADECATANGRWSARERKLERMIGEWREDVTAYAWYLYVNADPRPYNLEPVKHVEKFTSKAGKMFMNQLEDGGSITRFPLSAFLATSEGYIVEAKYDCRRKKATWPSCENWSEVCAFRYLDWTGNGRC